MSLFLPHPPNHARPHQLQVPSSEREVAPSSRPLTSQPLQFICLGQSCVALAALPPMGSDDLPRPLPPPSQEGSFRSFLPQDGASAGAASPGLPASRCVFSPHSRGCPPGLAFGLQTITTKLCSLYCNMQSPVPAGAPSPAGNACPFLCRSQCPSLPCDLAPGPALPADQELPGLGDGQAFPPHSLLFYIGDFKGDSSETGVPVMGVHLGLWRVVSCFHAEEPQIIKEMAPHLSPVCVSAQTYHPGDNNILGLQ